jgi:hypothetical protein
MSTRPLLHHRGISYFQTAAGWWVNAHDTYIGKHFWCETPADCVALIDSLREEELARENGTAAAPCLSWCGAFLRPKAHRMP